MVADIACFDPIMCGALGDAFGSSAPSTRLFVGDASMFLSFFFFFGEISDVKKVTNGHRQTRFQLRGVVAAVTAVSRCTQQTAWCNARYVMFVGQCNS